MIVKDEAPVIAACLASVLPIIDYWVICDTGSTDGTQDVVRGFFAKHVKPGELHQTTWRDFASNRTEALDLARPHGDYTLIIDADDVLVLPPRFRLAHLTADSYTFEIHHLELKYFRAQLVRSALPWRYEGVLHEFLSYADPDDGRRVFPETKNQRSLPGVQIHMGHGGARRRTDPAVRYARDVAVLQQALTAETDPFLVARYTFYLAQSLNHSGKKKEAIEIYYRRAKLGFWQQEVYISLYEIARIKATLGHATAEVVAAFQQAAAADPTRAEAFHGAARYCRENGRYEDGNRFAKQALRLRQPAEALFAEPWIYEYGVLDEFAVNAYWVGDYEECLKACRRLLSLGKRLPQEYLPRVEANAKLAREKLQQRRRVPQTANGGHLREVESAAALELPDAETSTGSTEINVADVGSPPEHAGAEQHSEERSAAVEPHTQLARAVRTSNTLHVLGVAHTVPDDDYLVCAFTAKILNFPSMIQPFGWHVVEYSNEGSASGAHEHITILTRERLRELSKRESREDPMDLDVHNEPLQKEFQRILMEKIATRAEPGDIICHIIGPNMQVYHALPQCRHLEMSVGYTASPGLPFRVYETSAWMHWHLGKTGREDGHNYNWVIPSAFDLDKWAYCPEPHDYAVFLGRVNPRKGISTLVEIARRVPDLPIFVYGPGDTSPWASEAPANLQFKGPVFGAERARVIRHARCMLMPTAYIEPFGFAGVEAQLCGVPLLGTSFGGFQETIIEGVTGYRCHTLADWVAAIELAASLDRAQISELARRKYCFETIGTQYNWVLQQLADLSQGGWYGEISRKFS